MVNITIIEIVFKLVLESNVIRINKIWIAFKKNTDFPTFCPIDSIYWASTPYEQMKINEQAK